MPDLHLVDFFLCEGTVEGDTLKDVILLGPESNNNREYSLAAMRSAVPFYEGRAIHCDHKLGVKLRQISERFGHAENVRVVEQDHDGKPRVRGDVPFLRSHPMAAQIVEAYQKKRPYFGISHVADGVGRKEGGRTFVEQITKVSSLDLVDRAATGSLVEQADAEPPADPAAEHQAGLDQMVLAICHGEGTPADKAKKIQTLLETMAPGDKPADAPPPPMSEATLRKVTGELVEQAVAKALTTALPQLVEQETARRAAAAVYVKPNTQPPGGPPAPEPPKKDAPPTDPAARKKWLHSN